MAIDGFLLQWVGGWGLAWLGFRWSGSRRWRARWRRSAAGLAPAAAIGGCAVLLRVSRGEVVHLPTPWVALAWAGGSAALLGFGSLWTAARLEARGKRPSSAGMAWLGGVVAMTGCLVQAVFSPAAGGFSWTPLPLLLLGGSGLLAGLCRKPRPTGTAAALLYVALAAGTAWAAGGW